MKIDKLNCYSNTKYYSSPAFGINLNSKKLLFKEEDFYVRMKKYGHHSGWARKIIETADNTVKQIREFCNFEETLKKVTNGVREANQLPPDIRKRDYSGILRTNLQGWNCDSYWSDDLITRYTNLKYRKYHEYADRLDYTAEYPLKNPYSNIELTRPINDEEHGRFIEHARGKYIKNAFKRVKFLYNDLYSKFIQKEIKSENLEEANSIIAEIRWILAHATPWARGSDAISNTFIRAIYKAMGVKTYPLKRGISLDLEAYCTNLGEYKKKFESYFAKKPEIVD